MAREKVVGKQPEKQTDNQRERKAASQSGRSRPAGRQADRHHNRSKQVGRQAETRIEEKSRSQ